MNKVDALRSDQLRKLADIEQHFEGILGLGGKRHPKTTSRLELADEAAPIACDKRPCATRHQRLSNIDCRALGPAGIEFRDDLQNRPPGKKPECVTRRRQSQTLSHRLSAGYRNRIRAPPPQIVVIRLVKVNEGQSQTSDPAAPSFHELAGPEGLRLAFRRIDARDSGSENRESSGWAASSPTCCPPKPNALLSGHRKMIGLSCV